MPSARGGGGRAEGARTSPEGGDTGEARTLCGRQKGAAAGARRSAGHGCESSGKVKDISDSVNT